MGYCHIKLDSDAQKLRTIVYHSENTNTNAYLEQTCKKYGLVLFEIAVSGPGS
jgi:hypothetical protein